MNDTLVPLVKTAIDPTLPSVAPALANAVERSAQNISKAIAEQFNEGHLNGLEKSLRAEFEKSLAADSWRQKFRGRDVLNRFVAHIHKVSYEVFRDLIIARMKDAGFEPEGMRLVISKILAA